IGRRGGARAAFQIAADRVGERAIPWRRAGGQAGEEAVRAGARAALGDPRLYLASRAGPPVPRRGARGRGGSADRPRPPREPRRDGRPVPYGGGGHRVEDLPYSLKRAFDVVQA